MRTLAKHFRNTLLLGLLLSALNGLAMSRSFAHDDDKQIDDPSGCSGSRLRQPQRAIRRPFPIDLGGPFVLTDHNGVQRRHDDFGRATPAGLFRLCTV